MHRRQHPRLPPRLEQIKEDCEPAHIAARLAGDRLHGGLPCGLGHPIMSRLSGTTSTLRAISADAHGETFEWDEHAPGGLKFGSSTTVAERFNAPRHLDLDKDLSVIQGVGHHTINGPDRIGMVWFEFGGIEAKPHKSKMSAAEAERSYKASEASEPFLRIAITECTTIVYDATRIVHKQRTTEGCNQVNVAVYTNSKFAARLLKVNRERK
mmetsp:Transcript_55598/g.153461  ORF Transcript_55598/g.153461 Transcript_55598/m.153461 type:complete len:211 (+) Transcript_55598:281-913(+)